MLDADIREPLLDYLDDIYYKNRVFEEKVMGKSRADMIMVVPEGFIGLEIKSDADTYERLERQVPDYDRFCNYNYIVIGKSHQKHVAEHVPEWWGILVAMEQDGQILIEQQRAPELNKKCKQLHQIKWLWRTELNHLLEKNHLPKYAAKSKKFVQDKLREKVPKEELLSQMVEELFERDYQKWKAEFEEYKAQKGEKAKVCKRKRRKKRSV